MLANRDIIGLHRFIITVIGGYQHDQCAFRQVEIGDKPVHGLKGIAGIDENRRFSPLLIIGSSLPLFIIQTVFILHNNFGMLVIGSVGIVTPVIFPNTENTMHYLLVQIGLQLFVYLPTYMLASYFGYKRRIRENEKMIEKHEATIQ